MTSESAAPAEMPGEIVERAWNAIADQFNQWSELGQDEKDSLTKFAAALFAPILAEKERERSAAVKQAGDLADGLVRALAIPRFGSPSCGYANPDDKTIAKAAVDMRARALAAEAALAAALEALGPFADEKNGAMQDILWGDQPDSSTITITCPLGQVRKAREVVRAAAIRAQE